MVFQIIDAVKRWVSLVGFITFEALVRGMAYFIKIFTTLKTHCPGSLKLFWSDRCATVGAVSTLN